MLTKLHIPVEQYGYVEVDVDTSTDDPKSVYEEIKRSFLRIDGLNQKDWNKVLDGYLNDGTLHSVEYEDMNEFQRGVIQELKKSFKRRTI